MKQKRDIRGRFTSTAVKIRKFIVKWFIILLMVAVPCFGGYMMFHNWLVSEFVYASVAVEYQAPTKIVDDRDLKEKVWDMLSEQDISLEGKINFMEVLSCESKFDPYAVNKNRDGSFDLGIAQWNLKYNPHVTKECAFDWSCAIQAMIDEYKKSGHLNKWVCNW